MKLDAALVWAFALVFVRCGAMLLSSPIFGGSTPAQVRVGLTTMVALALTPVLRPYLGEVPPHLYGMASAVAYEALIGLLIGSCLQMLMMGAQMAGALLDIQIGLGTIQIFNPLTQTPVSLFAQFKFLLALVLLLLMNGHHLMFQAFVASYQYAPLTASDLPHVQQGLLNLVGSICLLALQIAAPVAGVCVVVDAAAGIVNKSVPQMQAFMVTMPAKIMLGIVAMSLTLPAMTTAVQSGVEHTFRVVEGMLKEDGNGRK
ncbi:MAG: flagellar biosynthetic protein FliR [Fimbriimonadaceae bacterium]|nr:flagellar biosynthetic protein FliR [Fimbriimonadaceae bacterium]